MVHEFTDITELERLLADPQSSLFYFYIQQILDGVSSEQIEDKGFSEALAMLFGQYVYHLELDLTQATSRKELQRLANMETLFPDVLETTVLQSLQEVAKRFPNHNLRIRNIDQKVKHLLREIARGR